MWSFHWKTVQFTERGRQCRQTPSRLGRPHSRQNLEAENPENVSNYLLGKCVSRLHKNKQMYTFEYLRIGPYMAGRGQVTRHICKYKRLTLWGAAGKFPRRWEVEGGGVYVGRALARRDGEVSKRQLWACYSPSTMQNESMIQQINTFVPWTTRSHGKTWKAADGFYIFSWK